jgi:hypothetical protein
MPSDSVYFVEWSEYGSDAWFRCDDHDSNKEESERWAEVLKRSPHLPNGRLYRVSEYRRVETQEEGR